MLLPPNFKTRELRSDEIALVPYDSNIFFVIRLDNDNTKSSKDQRYKTQLYNKETNSYSETSYDLSYYQARNRLSNLISIVSYKFQFENERKKLIKLDQKTQQWKSLFENEQRKHNETKSSFENLNVLTDNMSKHIQKCELDIKFFIEKIQDYIKLFDRNKLCAEDMVDDIEPYLEAIKKEKEMDQENEDMLKEKFDEVLSSSGLKRKVPKRDISKPF